MDFPDHRSFSLSSCDTRDGNQVTQGQDNAQSSHLDSQLPLLVKKRDLDEMLASSSDAPFFSSDDVVDAGLENYQNSPRHKRKHRRKWYEDTKDAAGNMQALGTEYIWKRKSRGPFTRKYDSGIFMGSDESFQSESAEELLDLKDYLDGTSTRTEEEILADTAWNTTEDPGGFFGPVFPYWGKQPHKKQLSRFHIRQIEAQHKVMACVEAGSEVVDLSSLDLQQIRGPTLRSLRYFTKQPSSQEQGTVYQPLTPSLRLYLSNNGLDEVPGEAYHLTNLEVLSLRNNNITEILPSIGRLTFLRELSIGSNQLRWLPWAIQKLIVNGLQCTMDPNPLIRPSPSWWISDNQQRGRLRCVPWQAACTRPAFLGINGRDTISCSPPSPSQIEEYWAQAIDNVSFSRPDEVEQTKTPSLYETALRACYKHSHLSALPFFLPSEFPKLKRHVQRAWKIKEAGGQNCSVCGKFYILPRTEWVEWWYGAQKQVIYNPLDSRRVPLIPFLRQGCSWQCWVEGANLKGWTSRGMPEREDDLGD